MTPADRARLRALAQKAMNGPPGYDDAAQAALDAACYPATVLALLDIADAAEAARHQAKAIATIALSASYPASCAPIMLALDSARVAADGIVAGLDVALRERTRS